MKFSNVVLKIVFDVLDKKKAFEISFEKCIEIPCSKSLKILILDLVLDFFTKKMVACVRIKTSMKHIRTA